MMRVENLKKSVAKEGSENTEFKKTTDQQSEGAKTICPFLNGGGFLFFSKQSGLQEVISTQYGLRPECLGEAILQLLQEKPLSTSEIVKSLGYTSISGGLKHILQTLRKS